MKGEKKVKGRKKGDLRSSGKEKGDIMKIFEICAIRDWVLQEGDPDMELRVQNFLCTFSGA